MVEARVEEPVTKRLLDTDTLVVDALTAKRLENLSDEDPSPKRLSADGVMLPATWRRSDGVVTPSPSLPLAPSVRKLAPDEEAIERRLLPLVPVIASIADGVVDPSPSLPLMPRLSILVPVLEATANGLTVVVPCTKKVDVGVDEPTPTFPAASTVKY